MIAFLISVFLLFSSMVVAPVWAVFPTVESITASTFTDNTTGHAVAMPATVNVGDLLIILFIGEGGGVCNNTPSGWTLLWQEDGSGATFCAYAIDAIGDEDSTTVDVTTSLVTNAAVQTYRISGWVGTLSGLESAFDTGATDSTTPDPDSLTASWGVDDNLWIAWMGAINDAETCSAYPTNFDDNQTQTVADSGVNDSAEGCSATRNLNTATQDPGTFTISDSESWMAATLVVQPAAVTRRGTPIFFQ